MRPSWKRYCRGVRRVSPTVGVTLAVMSWAMPRALGAPAVATVTSVAEPGVPLPNIPAPTVPPLDVWALDLSPLPSGPGLLVAEPVLAAAGSADLAAFGAGCGRWLHLAAAGQPAFGQTPDWSSVDRVRRELHRADLRVAAPDAPRVAALLGVTHVALGAIGGEPGRVRLTYKVWSAKDQKSVGAPLTVSGTETEVAAALPGLARALAERLGAKDVASLVAAPDAADLLAAGRLPWAMGPDTTDADFAAAEPLAKRTPLAGLARLSFVREEGPNATTPIVRTLLEQMPDNPILLGEVARAEPFLLGFVGEHLRELSRAHPRNALLIQAALTVTPGGGEEQVRALAREVRCAPRNAEVWRALAEGLGDLAQEVRRSRVWMAIPEDEQEFLVAAYKRAEPIARRATELDPLHVSAWVRLAKAATFNGSDATARGAMWKALRLDPEHAKSYAWALEMFQPKWMDAPDDLQKVALQAAVYTLRPRDAALVVAETLRDLRLDKDANAVAARVATAYQADLKRAPEDPKALAGLAESLRLQRKYEDAIGIREALIRVTPNDPDAHRRLGHLFYALKRNAEAERAYREAVRLDPNNAALRVDLSFAIRFQKRYADAEKEAREAIRVDPKLAQAHYSLGLALTFQDGRDDEAIVAFREAIRLSPLHVGALQRLSEALRLKGQIDEAIQTGIRAVQADPRAANSYEMLGLALNKAQRYQEAADVFDQGIEAAPRDAGLRVWYGNMLQKLNRQPEARTAWEEALRLDPNGPDGARAKKALGR